MVIIKFFLLDVLAFVSIGCISCTNKKGAEMKIVHTTQEKDSISSSLCKKNRNSRGYDSTHKLSRNGLANESLSDFLPAIIL